MSSEGKEPERERERDEGEEPVAAEQHDVAAETGKLAGRAFNRIGLSLLRLRSVRQAIRRGAREAAPEKTAPERSAPGDPQWPAPSRSEPPASEK